MTVSSPPICSACARLEAKPDAIGYRCEAFPDAIPDAIYLDGADHRQPIEGDHGVRFVLAEDDPMAASLLATYEEQTKGSDA
jgi:hypothetical protein